MLKLKKINKYLFFISLTLSIYFLLRKPPLPSQNQLLPQLINNPPNFMLLDKPEYNLKFNDQTYKIIPKANYEIYGLVVESYDAENPLDYAHRNDPAQFKDLCLVWGENLKSGGYLNTKFKHGEFTCFFRFTRDGSFDPHELSNNHLLPASPEIKKLIKNANIGDQVKITGELINYRILDENNNEIYFRNTSDNLEDKNCEIILVNDFEILSNHNQLRSIIKKTSLLTLIFTSTLTLASFFI